MVDGEEADGSIILWAHVGDGGSVRSGQLGHTGSKKLYKPSSDPSLT